MLGGGFEEVVAALEGGSFAVVGEGIGEGLGGRRWVWIWLWF